MHSTPLASPQRLQTPPRWAPRIVIDPVSVCMGMVYGDPQARRLIDLCREGRCIPLVSEETVNELCQALSSPFFSHPPKDTRKSMLRDFVRLSRRLRITGRSLGSTPVPEGMASVLLAMAGRAQVLITSRPESVPRAQGMNFKVMTPAAFLSELVPEVHFVPHRSPALH